MTVHPARSLLELFSQLGEPLSKIGELLLTIDVVLKPAESLFHELWWDAAQFGDAVQLVQRPGAFRFPGVQLATQRRGADLKIVRDLFVLFA